MACKLLYRKFSGKVNYYEVLGIPESARPDEVKLAYRKLVKELHPDVAGTNVSQEKFRLVTEAYTVLSKLETRATYDLTQGSKSEIEKILDKKRDKDGVDLEKPKYAPHQYGYKRLKELAEERKKYNIDNFYRYKGGLPNKHLLNIRGNAYGSPGKKADVYDLNFVLKGHNQISRESDYVDNVEAHEFKLAKAIDADNIMKTKPFLRAEIDYDFTKAKTLKRHFWFYFGVLALVLSAHFIEEIPKIGIQLAIHKIKENADTSAQQYKKAGLRAVGFN